MSQRIRYSKTSEEGVLQSVKKFEANGKQFKIVINTNEKSWLVVNDDGDIIEASGRGPTLHNIKLAAKETLAKLGVSFTAESRNGKKLDKAS